MKREEMQAKGLVPEETRHSGHRRACWHDYGLPGIYMLTLVTEGRQRVFGTVVGRSRAAKGTADYPHLQFSPFGKVVLEEEIPKITWFYPMVEVWKVILMPDHIHLLVYVREKLPQGKHLGLVVSGFKAGCSRAWWKWQDEQKGALGRTLGHRNGFQAGRGFGDKGHGNGLQAGTGFGGAGVRAAVGNAVTVPEGSPEGHSVLRPTLFQAGYHDRIIRDARMLENVRRYMDENPFRAKLREEVPRLMQRRLHLWINHREYAAFGNLFLLKNPEKIQVFFHRRNETGTPTHLTPEYAIERDRLLRRAEEGAVLVTPGISKGEQEVVHAALSRQLPLIILQKEPISDFWKPSQGRFFACASGCLLILAPWQLEGDSDYFRFHMLNDFAREICLCTEPRVVGLFQS